MPSQINLLGPREDWAPTGLSAQGRCANISARNIDRAIPAWTRWARPLPLQLTRCGRVRRLPRSQGPPAVRSMAQELASRRAAGSVEQVALSLSRAQPHVRLYHSERLLDTAASGGCVLSEAFPGIELLYPAGTVQVRPDRSCCAIRLRRRMRAARAAADCSRRQGWVACCCCREALEAARLHAAALQRRGCCPRRDAESAVHSIVASFPIRSVLGGTNTIHRFGRGGTTHGKTRWLRRCC